MRVAISFYLAALFAINTPAIQADDPEREAQELLDNYVSFRADTIEASPETNVTLSEYRQKTIARLVEIGIEGRVILPELMQVFHRYPDEWEHSHAWQEWEKYFYEMQGEAVPFLVKELSSRNPDIRSTALSTLGLIGREAEPAVPALVGMLDDKDMHDIVMWALLEIGRPVDLILPEVIKSIQDDEENYYTFHTLVEFNQPASLVLPLVVKAMQDPSQREKSDLFGALATFDEKGDVSIPFFTAALTDAEDANDEFYTPPCMFAARELAAMKQRAAPAIPAIIDVLREGLVNKATIRPLMETLVNNPERAQEAIPLLDNEFERGPLKTSADLANRIYVASALMQLKPDHQAAYEFIVNVVRGGYDPEHYVRLHAVKALLKLGRRDPLAIQILKKVVADGEAGVFEKQFDNKGQFSDFSVLEIPAYAEMALARIDPTDDFTSARIEQRLHALMLELDVETLVIMMMPNAEYYRKRLAAMAFADQYSYWSPSHQYVELVAALDCFDEIATQIERDIRNKDSSYQQLTEDLLPWLKPYHRKLTPLFLTLLDHDDHHIRRRASGALGLIADDNPEAIQGLLAALDDPQPTVRSRAADALGDVTTTGETELRALQAAHKDEYLCVRAAAERAIRQIEGSEPAK